MIQQSAALLLATAGTVTEVVLTPGATVILPDGTSAPLAQAARTLPDVKAQSTFELELAGDGLRELGLSYVTEALAWKTSWRLLLDEGRLQGWATFENTSGHDWTGVAVTLDRRPGDALLGEQDRLRDNLGVVQSDDLRRRYEAELAGREDEIAATLKDMDAARTAIRAGERELDRIIGQFQ